MRALACVGFNSKSSNELFIMLDGYLRFRAALEKSWWALPQRAIARWPVGLLLEGTTRSKNSSKRIRAVVPVELLEQNDWPLPPVSVAYPHFQAADTGCLAKASGILGRRE